MNLQDSLASLEVGQLHRHAAVEAARARERGVEGFGAVRGSENDDAVVALKAVHFGEQLVQGLLALVVAAVLAAAALLADGVDLVDEDDAGGLLLGLLEEVTHLARAHADEHFDKFGARHREERHIRLAGDRLGEHRFTGSRRADEQDALGHRRADLLIFAGVVQVVDDLGEVLLGLILARDIVKLDALGGLDIHLGVGLAHVEHHGVASAAHLLHHLARHILSQRDKDDDGQHPGENADKCGRLLDLLTRGGDARVQKALHQTVVRHHCRLVDGLFIAAGEENAVGLLLDLDPADLALLCHGDESVVVDVLDLVLRDPRHGDEVEEHHKQHRHKVVVQQRLFRGLDFVHENAFLRSLKFPAGNAYKREKLNVAKSRSFCYAERRDGRSKPPGT